MSGNGTGPVQPRSDVLRVQIFGQVLSIIGVVVVGSILVLEIISMIQRRKKLRLHSHRASLKTSVNLLAITLGGLLIQFHAMALWLLVDWNTRVDQCTPYTLVVSLSYITTKQCVYIFLFQRMKVAHNALALNGLFLRIIRWMVFLAITVGVTASFIPLILVYFVGIVEPEGICVQVETSPVPVLFFATCDLLLNGLMLFLFFVPLTKHAQGLGGASGSTTRKTLLMYARRNLIISTCMTSITVSALLFMMYSMLQVEVHSDEPGGPNAGAMQVLHTEIVDIDVIVSVLGSHLISMSWVPDTIKHYLEKHLPSWLLRKKTDTQSNNSRKGAVVQQEMLLVAEPMHVEAEANPAVALPVPSTGSISKLSHIVPSKDDKCSESQQEVEPGI